MSSGRPCRRPGRIRSRSRSGAPPPPRRSRCSPTRASSSAPAPSARVEHAEQAAAAGASFAVSPGLDRDVVERCADLGLTPLPGIATASELTAALALGISTVKLFPAEVVGGAALIRALAAPFPDARFVPTGGLNAQNAGSYLELPEVLAIGGSWMVAPALLSAGRWDEVEHLTREALAL